MQNMFDILQDKKTSTFITIRKPQEKKNSPFTTVHKPQDKKTPTFTTVHKPIAVSDCSDSGIECW